MKVILQPPLSGRGWTCRAGVWCFADSPGRDAAVFWSPSECPHVLPAIAMPPSSWSPERPFDFERLRCRTILLETADGLQHVMLQNDAGKLQLAIFGADVRRPVWLHVEAVWSKRHVGYRLRALQCLNALSADGQLPIRLFPPEARGRRLCFVIRALDASLAGALHREIAEVLIGKERVNADWADPGNHLRDRIRRAVRRGHALMTGGYRDFLS